MKYCIRCAKEIGEGHDYCPYCGTPQNKSLKQEYTQSSSSNSSKTVIVIGALILVALAVIIAALLEKPSSNHQTNRNETSYYSNKDSSIPQKGSVQVSASQILSEFKNNEIRAGEKYNGKRITIIGCAADIDNSFGVLTVSVNSCGGLLDLDYVLAEFPGHQKNKLASLNKGQRLAVECTIVDGGNIMGVHGTNCTIR